MKEVIAVASEGLARQVQTGAIDFEEVIGVVRRLLAVAARWLLSSPSVL